MARDFASIQEAPGLLHLGVPSRRSQLRLRANLAGNAGQPPAGTPAVTYYTIFRRLRHVVLHGGRGAAIAFNRLTSMLRKSSTKNSAFMRSAPAGATFCVTQSGTNGRCQYRACTMHTTSAAANLDGVCSPLPGPGLPGAAQEPRPSPWPRRPGRRAASPRAQCLWPRLPARHLRPPGRPPASVPGTSDPPGRRASAVVAASRSSEPNKRRRREPRDVAPGRAGMGAVWETVV